MIDWLRNNWATTIALILSIVALLFTALKDFILPWFFKPKLEITYLQKEPYKRQVNINAGPNSTVIGFFDRFKIENIGKNTAKNCRCQIYSIKDKTGKELDLQGFPIKWASRPDSAVDFTKAERLNIGQGESEFVDLAHAQTNAIGYFYFEPYHNVPIGMTNQVPIKNYIVKVIISGDNFKPYIATFKINGQPKYEHILEITLEEVTRK